jgi:hypothetical protein
MWWILLVDIERLPLATALMLGAPHRAAPAGLFV